MRCLRAWFTVAAVSLTLPGSSWAAAADRAPLHIVPPSTSVDPGGAVQFRDVPPASVGASPGFKRIWIAWGAGSMNHDTGLYLAPYVVPSPGSRVRIVLYRGLKPDLDSAEALVDLLPGSVPGGEECLGPGQTWSASGRGLDYKYKYVDELPVAITSVPPQYPPWAAARNLSGSLIVNAIVCRNGRVLDATSSWPVGATPIPELDELAFEAARQWVFKPASVGGQAVATTVAIPFTFPPR